MMLIYSLVNPFAEEVVVRGYLMTELKKLTNKTWLAVAVSLSLQCAYHLYQGTPAALSYLGLFSVYAVYYARTGRLWPVIIAHMMMDLAAVFR